MAFLSLQGVDVNDDPGVQWQVTTHSGRMIFS